MGVKYNSSGGGSVLLDAPSTASNLTVTLPSASGTLLCTGAPFSGGTANGVVYLNGSSVPTTGSALTWNGSTFVANGAIQTTGGDLYLKRSSTNDAAIYFGSNTDCSIYSGNANEIMSFAVSNAEQMRLTSTGLGIGTSSPSAPLTVQGNSSGYGINIIGRSGGQNESWLYWYKNGGSTLNAGILGDNQGMKFAIGASATEMMRLDASGNLGLGVTPSAWYTGAKAIQFGTLAGISLSSNGDSEVLNNAYEYASGAYKTTYGFSAAASKYTQSAGSHYWSSAASTASGGVISFTQVLATGKDVSVALQGATTKSGTGITFPATQSASSDANTLDDYEEGSWTPTDASGAGLSFTVYSGKYIKIGRVVTCSCDIRYPSTANTSNVSIGGLPFVSENTSSLYGSVTFNYTTQNSTFLGLVGPNGTIIGVNNLAGNSLTNANFSLQYFVFTATYFAAS